MHNVFSKHRKGQVDEGMFEMGARGLGTIVLLVIFVAIMALFWPYILNLFTAISAFYKCIGHSDISECITVIKNSLGWS